MIAQITGTVVDKDEKGVVIDNNGIGYLVFMTPIDMPMIGNDVTILTVFVVREDAQELYGFTNKTSRDLFKLLITISGIGPRSALGILSLASPKRFINLY
jgi:Holliday junction DNA helicase RuvA